jgi:hypothetical protein
MMSALAMVLAAGMALGDGCLGRSQSRSNGNWT